MHAQKSRSMMVWVMLVVPVSCEIYDKEIADYLANGVPHIMRMGINKYVRMIISIVQMGWY